MNMMNGNQEKGKPKALTWHTVHMERARKQSTVTVSHHFQRTFWPSVYFLRLQQNKSKIEINKPMAQTPNRQFGWSGPALDREPSWYPRAHECRVTCGELRRATCIITCMAVLRLHIQIYMVGCGQAKCMRNTRTHTRQHRASRANSQSAFGEPGRQLNVIGWGPIRG